jgi:HD-GYP domain-containing protein (c-di-GMP phosphodiesterase class II)
MNDIILLAYLHDIGKMSIPDAILTKPTKLSSIEWETMKRHPKLGADFVGRIPDLSSAATGILYHHENWDGSGYPEGLSETNIPLVARIIRVVDSFDAMTNTRSYNRIKTKTEALNEIINYSGVHYDPEVVDVFSEIIRNEIEENRKTQSKNTEEKQHKIVRLY